jgi:hypothetical protein
MSIRTGFSKSHTEIDGRHCLPRLWSRFSLQRTTSDGGRKFYRQFIVDNFISYSIPAPCSHREIVEQIAKHSRERIPVESLPKDLANTVFARGNVIFGFPGDYFDRIALNYKNMRWWFSKRGLKMGVISRIETNISPFDEYAGRLMHKAQSRRLSNGRFPLIVCATIGRALDRRDFKPVDHLEGLARKRLADWNQKHPLDAIHTFERAMKSRVPWLRRAAKRRLYRAADKFKKNYS